LGNQTNKALFQNKNSEHKVNSCRACARILGVHRPSERWLPVVANDFCFVHFADMGILGN
jgi:hypothetical protein